MNDQLQRFMFKTAPVRGEFVTLHQTWHDVLSRRDYPAPVRTMLGEMMAAAALLSANLKFDGALVIQIYGDGPLRMLVVECHADLTMRATAKLAVDAAEIAPDASFTDLVNTNGQGRCAITLDPRDKKPGQQPYQGVVPLTDETGPIPTIAKVLEHYMHRSEQLDTRLWLAADAQQAVGMLLQKLPLTGGLAAEQTAARGGVDYDADTWERVCALGATLNAPEMLDADAQTVLHRLFWEEPRESMASGATRFACTCSREKVGGMLTMLGLAEVESILAESGEVEVHCEFCNQRYVFDPVDAAQLFISDAAATIAPAPEQRH